MTMPGGHFYDPDEDFRLLFDEVGKKYYIQKKRLIFGWKFLDFKYREKRRAIAKITSLRKDNRKRRVKKRFVVIDS